MVMIKWKKLSLTFKMSKTITYKRKVNSITDSSNFNQPVTNLKQVNSNLSPIKLILQGFIWEVTDQ